MNPEISDPCLPQGATFEQNGFEFVGSGNYSSCYNSLKPLLHKVNFVLLILNFTKRIKDTCLADDATCSLDGHYQPPMNGIGEFFGFSEFYYTSSDCLGIAGRWNLDLFQKESAAYCATEWSVLKSNLALGKYKADENRLRQQCFKSAWVPVSIF